jgi:hypothetical protein
VGVGSQARMANNNTNKKVILLYMVLRLMDEDTFLLITKPIAVFFKWKDNWLEHYTLSGITVN